MTTTTTDTDSFSSLGKELKERLKQPLLNFTYWTHLLMGVCFYGAIGVWAEFLRRYVVGAESSNGNLILALHVTYPAIIGATAMQIILNSKQKSYLRAFAQIVSTAFFCLAAVSILATFASDGLRFTTGIFGNVCAMLFWWIANAREEGLKDANEVDPNEMVGGSLPEEEAYARAEAGEADPVIGGDQPAPIETSVPGLKL